jgi:hypothetical protein
VAQLEDEPVGHHGVGGAARLAGGDCLALSAAIIFARFSRSASA